jgi:hypothetical protein
MTWKVRRIGNGLWSSVRASNRSAWSWIERVQRQNRTEQSVTALTQSFVSLRSGPVGPTDAPNPRIGPER